MSRLTIPTKETTPSESRAGLTAVEKQLGVVPNLFRVLAKSPAALQGFLGLMSALGTSLDVKTRERIAIASAQQNGCDYCLSAHTYLGINVAKLEQAEIDRNRLGHSDEPKADAIVQFALKVLQKRGKVADEDISAVKQAGYTEGQIVEVVGVVALQVFSNYLNNVTRTDIDFPIVHTAQAA
jgi:uncharacterized peroxidase-related enzyme